MKKRINLTHLKIGVLGGGQLGRMLYQDASKWGLNMAFLDKSKDFPVGQVCVNFMEGDFRDYRDVLEFGKDMDIVTIEIENVNTRALYELEKQGISVYPQASIVETIKNKGLQKDFYTRHDIPTCPYIKTNNKADVYALIETGKIAYPFIQKKCEEGYDGRGVVAIMSQDEDHQIFEEPSIVENFVNIDMELSVIVGRNADGQCVTYPVSEMVFNKQGHLLDMLVCPARIGEKKAMQARQLAEKVAERLDIVGLLAVEMFLTPDGRILVNEVAPRPHNSGHHTIEAFWVSQYEQLIRAITGLPLLQTDHFQPAVMINLLGERGFHGTPHYEGLDMILEVEGVFPHIYGKAVTKPLRKMGHVTVVRDKLSDAIDMAQKLKNHIKVKS